MNRTQRHSYYEADARERIAGLIDAGSFSEFLGPARRMMSPHLAQLDQPAAFDDGIVVGEATLQEDACCWPHSRVNSWAAAWARCMAPS